MQEMRIVGDLWPGSPIKVANSFLDNLRGINGLPDGKGILLRKRAVHTFGMNTMLWGVGVDSSGTVLAVKKMRPNRFFHYSACAYVMELPREIEPPAPGDRLRVVA
jgi:hypothetical protein